MRINCHINATSTNRNYHNYLMKNKKVCFILPVERHIEGRFVFIVSLIIVSDKFINQITKCHPLISIPKH